jgi:hypothetical protein
VSVCYAIICRLSCIAHPRGISLGEARIRVVLGRRLKPPPGRRENGIGGLEERIRAKEIKNVTTLIKKLVDVIGRTSIDRETFII